MPYHPPSFAGLDNPVREILDRSQTELSLVVDSTMSSQATSGDLGVMVQWDHGTRTVEVRLECVIQINGITQAAGLKAQCTTFICDVNASPFAAYASNPLGQSVTQSFGMGRHVFHDTTTGFHASIWTCATVLIDAVPGTTMSFNGRAYQSVGSAATWSGVIGGANNGPIMMTAREIL